MSQISFNFPLIDRYLDDDFICCKENETAFNFIQNYHNKINNIANIFTIYGKNNSGKSHLAHIWQRKMNAIFIDIDSLKDFDIAGYIENNKSYIIKNIDQIQNQINLFHLFNIINEKNCHLMLTSNVNLNKIQYQFKDLESRLKNIFTIEIKDPDIELVKMLLIKQFSMRQLSVESRVIDYIAKNIDRNYDEIVKVSRLLEFYCFEKNKNITIPFVSEIGLKKDIKQNKAK